MNAEKILILMKRIFCMANAILYGNVSITITMPTREQNKNGYLSFTRVLSLMVFFIMVMLVDTFVRFETLNYCYVHEMVGKLLFPCVSVSVCGGASFTVYHAMLRIFCNKFEQ